MDGILVLQEWKEIGKIILLKWRRTLMQRIGLRAGNRSDFGGNEHNIDGF